MGNTRIENIKILNDAILVKFFDVQNSKTVFATSGQESSETDAQR